MLRSSFCDIADLVDIYIDVGVIINKKLPMYKNRETVEE